MFLQENFPSFVDEAAMDDTAAMASQLSDAGMAPFPLSFEGPIGTSPSWLSPNVPIALLSFSSLPCLLLSSGNSRWQGR